MDLAASTILVGADTPLSFTNGTKTNDAWVTQQVSDLNKLGVHWFRWMPYAYSIETSPGVYKWGNLDSVVKTCNANGINLLLAALKPPAWGTIENKRDGTPITSWMLAYSKAMAQRYDGNHGFGQIQAIEIGNEDWGFGDNPAGLAAAMNACYPAIKGQYPNLIVGPGSNVHRNTALITTWVNTLWNQCPNKFDYMNIHYYCQNNNSSDPSVDGSTFPSWSHMISICQNAAANAGHANFPLWVTETGWPINCNAGAAAQYIVSPQVQANYTKYILDYFKANVPNGKISLYTLAYAVWGAASCGVGTGNGFSAFMPGYTNPTPLYTMLQNYPKNWGGGSSIGSSIRDVSARAKVRIGVATSIRDIVAVAKVKRTGTLKSGDILVRAGVSGAGTVPSEYDTFQRAPQPQWGTASDGVDAWVQAGGSATASIILG